MKIKLPQILGGIAALATIFSFFLFFIDSLIENYVSPLSWLISFIVEVSTIITFTIVFKNIIVRYLAAGMFILCRLIFSLYWMNNYEESIPYFAKLFVGWPYWGSVGVTLLANLFGFLAFVLFVSAVILSLRYPFQTSSPTPGNSGNRTVPTITHTPPVQVRKAQSAYADIEVLGDLLKKGLLTQEEFDLKKREILGLDK
jgi:hypothetical protein